MHINGKWRGLYNGMVHFYSINDIKERNSIIIKSEKEVLLVDPSDDESFVSTAKELIGNRDLLILYSHSHINHLRGVKHFNCKNIIAQKKLLKSKDFILEMLTKPNDLYESCKEIKLGSSTVQIKNLAGHTDDLSIIFIDDYKLLFSSDLLLENSLPFVDHGTVRDYFNSLEKLKALQPEVIIPGHGNLSEGLKLIERYQYYFDKLISVCSQKDCKFEEASRYPISFFQNEEYKFIIKEFHEHNIKSALKENCNTYSQN